MQSQFIPLFHGLRDHRNVVPTFRERTKRIAAFCRALSWPKTNLGYKIRVLDLSESLACIRNVIISVRVETVQIWKEMTNRLLWNSSRIKGAERTTILCFVVVSGTQRGDKLTTSSERVDPGTERRVRITPG